ncbi:MAG: PDZ domain-containing protein [Phycisphaeraceae bacterium]|nr:PDZ domain-containing protein [Phycisphaeraceae bacterium]MCB9847756.1 PDZ domain-containing protein [Phycisphaeraceae bacterium]
MNRTRTHLLKLAAGGVCSLAIAGAVNAETAPVVVQVCDTPHAAAPHAAAPHIIRHEGEGGHRIVIELDGENGPIVLDGDDLDFDFDFDFDFDWAEQMHSGADHKVIKKQIEKAHKQAMKAREKAGKAKRVLVEKLGVGGGGCDVCGPGCCAGGQAGAKGRTLRLGGPQGLGQGGRHEVIIKRLGGDDDDFSMGDLGLDDADGNVEVIINGKPLGGLKGLNGLKELKQLKQLKELKGLKDLKGSGHGVWQSDDGSTFRFNDGNGNVIFLEGAGVVAPADVVAPIGEPSFNVAIGDIAADDFTFAADNQPAPAVVGKPRMMIGVTLGSISEALASQLGVDAEGVLMIESVSDGMPAAMSGLRRFDIITSVDGESPVSTPMLQKLIASKHDGENVTIKVLRGGDPHTFKVSPVPAPSQHVVAPHLAEIERDQAARRAERQAERAVRGAERDQERADTALARAKERFEKQRERVQLRRENSGQDISAILQKLEELNVELDPETMAQLKDKLAELHDRFEGADFAFEMPNIEFVPGDGEDEGIVVIEGSPDARFFEQNGEFYQFVPGGKGGVFSVPGGQGEFRFEVTPDGAPHADHDVFFGRNPDVESRLDALEARMSKIEQLLERLAERLD